MVPTQAIKTSGGEHMATRLLCVVPMILAYLIEDEV